MENAVEALKTAAAILVFVIAITVSFTMFSKAKTTADSIITMQDKQEYLDFLAELFTDADYVEMAYLTGRKPISAFTNNKYLDMFTEFELTNESSKDKETVGIY